jgi:hypothetical protein
MTDSGIGSRWPLATKLPCLDGPFVSVSGHSLDHTTLHTCVKGSLRVCDGGGRVHWLTSGVSCALYSCDAFQTSQVHAMVLLCFTQQLCLPCLEARNAVALVSSFALRSL